MPLVVGLDFGMSFCSMAESKKGMTMVIRNSRRNLATPCLVAFSERRLLVGDEARKSTVRAENVVFGMKRLMGRSFEDGILKADFNRWPSSLKNNNGMPEYLVQCGTEKNTFRAEEIAAIILNRLKETKESSGKPVDGAVLTVPSSFGPAQCRAMLDAAAIAGIRVLQLLEETTAAAIAYTLEKKIVNRQRTVIFHLGGTAADVAVFDIAENSIQLLANVASSHLGGEDFDQNLLQLVLQKLKKGNSLDARKNPVMMAKLRSICVKAKEDLTVSDKASISIDTAVGTIQLGISSKEFESVNEPLYLLLQSMLDTALHEAKLDAKEINYYFVIGRSTRMPWVINMLDKKFGEKKRRQIVNADDAAVTGAALLAEFLSGQMDTDLTIRNTMANTVRIVGSPDDLMVHRERACDVAGKLIPVKSKASKLGEYRSSFFTSVQEICARNKLHIEVEIRNCGWTGLSANDVKQLASKAVKYRSEDQETLDLKREIEKLRESASDMQIRIERLLDEMNKTPYYNSNEADQISYNKERLENSLHVCKFIKQEIDERKCGTKVKLHAEQLLLQGVEETVLRYLSGSQEEPEVQSEGTGHQHTSVANYIALLSTEIEKLENILRYQNIPPHYKQQAQQNFQDAKQWIQHARTNTMHISTEEAAKNYQNFTSYLQNLCQSLHRAK